MTHMGLINIPLPSGFFQIMLVFLIGATVCAGISVFLAHWSLGWWQTRKKKVHAGAILTAIGTVLPVLIVLFVLSWCVMIAMGALRAGGFIAPLPAQSPTKERTTKASQLIFDVLGVVSLVFVGTTVLAAIKEPESFAWVVGHAMLYLFPILIPLYLGAFWLSALLVRRLAGLWSVRAF